MSPDLLPSRRVLPAGDAADLAPHATTIVAATYEGGVVMAGDRRATMGNIIAQRDIEKVFPTDEFSCVGIAGTAGLAVEMVRLFQTELEHYEKIEGTTLSMDGKANRLSALIRGNLGMAMQGLAVVPLFAGFDLVGPARADLLLRRHRRPLRGDRVPLGRVGLGVRQGLAEEALPRGLRRGPVRDGRRAGAVRRCRRRLRHRWPRPGPPDLPGRQRDHDDGHVRLSQEQVAAIADQVVAGRLQRPDGPAAQP